MRLALFAFLLVPGFATAQLTDAEKRKTLEYVQSLYDPATGAYKDDSKSKPGLRATSGAVRSLIFLGAVRLGMRLSDPKQTTAFVISCYDATNGGFREPGGTPDMAISCIGIITCTELSIPESQFPKAIEYLKENASSFEDVRIGAAALESLKKKPDWLDQWIKIADAQLNNDGTAGKGDGRARDTANVAAMKLRLGFPLANKAKVIEAIASGQRPDGGWGKADAKRSDLESTYRVMRALHLLKEKPKDSAKLTAFLKSCRNTDSGYSVEPGGTSTLSGVYYATAINKWIEK